MQKRTEKIRDADLYSVIPSRDKKSAGIDSDPASNRSIDADRIQQEQNEIRAQVCDAVFLA
ncbi:MAG TPA: hypothetical protein O0X50_03640 [Methanocorpusculum sp.]|nr:hypothetical protein [Methanocorpusculum sp.]